MKLAKVSTKAFIVPLNFYAKKTREGAVDFATLLFTVRNEVVPFKRVISNYERDKNLEAVVGKIPRVPLGEKKISSSTTRSVVEQKREEEFSTRENRSRGRIQKVRERSAKNEDNPIEAPQTFGTTEVKGNVSKQTIRRSSGALKLDESKPPETVAKKDVAQDSISNVFERWTKDSVVQDPSVLRRSDGDPAKVEQGGKMSGEKILKGEKIEVSIEVSSPVKLHTTEAREREEPLRDDIPTFLLEDIPIVRDYNGAEALMTTKEKPTEQAPSTKIPTDKNGEGTSIKAGLELTKLFENSVEGTIPGAAAREVTHAWKREKGDVLKETSWIQTPAKSSPIQSKTPFESQKDVSMVSNGKKGVTESPFMTQSKVEGKVTEKNPLKVGEDASLSEGRDSSRVFAGSWHRTSEENVSDQQNQREMKTTAPSLGHTLSDVKNLRRFQEIESDILQRTGVPIFYERREKLEDFREVFDENLSELVQRSRVREIYSLHSPQGVTGREETVPPHSLPKIVEMMYVQKQERALMTLNPPELGRVEVVIEKSGEEVRVVLKVFTEEAKNALEREVPQLVERLSERGFDVHVQVERHQERDLLQEGKDRRERRQREKYPNRTEGEDFSETMKEVVG